MKKIIVFLLSFCSVYAQNFEPGQHQFMINGNPTYINADSGYFKPDRFILGWNWGTPGKPLD